jgi:hypothetical protein
MGCSDICCVVGFAMWRELSGQKEVKSSAMTASLDAASLFFQASHSGDEQSGPGANVLRRLHACSFRSQFLCRHDAPKDQNRNRQSPHAPAPYFAEAVIVPSSADGP